MTFEFDHLFILTDIGAPEADRLSSFGLVEGSSRTHRGQGTTNRCFFFHNAMLELLWVRDPEEAQSEPIRQTRLWERSTNRNNGACPFGICLRPATGSEDKVAFSSWQYHPPYLPETISIAVATNSDNLTEPMLFQIPWGKRPDRFSAQKSPPLNHGVGFREITRVELVSPAANNPSPELQAVLETNQVKLRLGTEYFVELGFDGEVQGKRVDFRPGLPLIISW
ncbi:VOC family protein [Microcoleus sp. ARI1-B5]|uniref:VOC family protein n=1 Tax=unclassified Microcoleus TaxID=2642155 RepID=UPI002FD6F579